VGAPGHNLEGSARMFGVVKQKRKEIIQITEPSKEEKRDNYN